MVLEETYGWKMHVRSLGEFAPIRKETVGTIISIDSAVFMV